MKSRLPGAGSGQKKLNSRVETGLFPSMKNVKYYRVRRVEMRSNKETLVQVDGDYLGELPMTAEIVPNAVDIYC